MPIGAPASSAYGLKPYRINSTQATGKAVTPGHVVDTTSATAVAAPGSVAITLAKPMLVQVGMLLAIYGGTGTAEIVPVTATDGTGAIVTCTFANTHSGTYNVTSLKGTLLGTVYIAGQGTGMTLTLYDGAPQLVGAQGTGNVPNDYGATLSIITPNSGAQPNVMVHVKHGLFYSYAGGTPGEVLLGVAAVAHRAY